MPGFRIGEVGDGHTGADHNAKPYYSYTWEIPNLFGDSTRETSLIYARDLSLPEFNVDKEEIEGASLIYKVASMINWADVRLVFYDIPKGGTSMYQYLNKWMRSIWTDTDGIKPADEYKKDTILTVYNSVHRYSRSWRLIGSWPQSIRDGQLSYASNDVKLVEIVISHDWAELLSDTPSYTIL